MNARVFLAVAALAAVAPAPAAVHGAGPAKSRASCQYEIQVVIDPARNQLRGEGSFLFRYLEDGGNELPLIIDPSLTILESELGESGLARSPGLDPRLSAKWEGWPSLAGRSGPSLTYLSQDYVLLGPDMLYYPGSTNDKVWSSGTFAISAPERFQVVTDGTLLAETSRQGFRNSRFAFGGLHGRPRLTALTLYPLVRDTTGRVEIRVLVNPANRGAIPGLVARVRAILDAYEALLGPYLYPSLTLLEAPRAVGSDFLLGSDIAGLGLKGIVLVASDQLSGELDESLLAHELAHQWWGGQIGLDGTPGAGGLWIIEGFAEYSSLLWAQQRDGAAARPSQLAAWARGTRQTIEESGDESLARLDRGKGGKALLAYTRGPFVLSMIEQRTGPERFRTLLPALVKEWQGIRPTTADFERDLGRLSGDDWKTFFAEWVRRKGMPEARVRYAVTRLADGRHRVLVEGVQERPYFSLALPLRLFEGEKVTEAVLALEGPASRLELLLASDPTALVVDPDGTVLVGSLTTTRVDPLELP